MTFPLHLKKRPYINFFVLRNLTNAHHQQNQQQRLDKQQPRQRKHIQLQNLLRFIIQNQRPGLTLRGLKELERFKILIYSLDSSLIIMWLVRKILVKLKTRLKDQFSTSIEFTESFTTAEDIHTTVLSTTSTKADMWLTTTEKDEADYNRFRPNKPNKPRQVLQYPLTLTDKGHKHHENIKHLGHTHHGHKHHNHKQTTMTTTKSTTTTTTTKTITTTTTSRTTTKRTTTRRPTTRRTTTKRPIIKKPVYSWRKPVNRPKTTTRRKTTTTKTTTTTIPTTTTSTTATTTTKRRTTTKNFNDVAYGFRKPTR